jgi:hypothetical protein
MNYVFFLYFNLTLNNYPTFAMQTTGIEGVRRDLFVFFKTASGPPTTLLRATTGKLRPSVRRSLGEVWILFPEIECNEIVGSINNANYIARKKNVRFLVFCQVLLLIITSIKDLLFDHTTRLTAINRHYQTF